ncbi:MAG: DNA translocase FtsK 4TM domain-containing protein [Victivallales bacterium]|nr:DNA translocase FtsK 4TM domain-containing protein [Victivallales bacterium]
MSTLYSKTTSEPESSNSSSYFFRLLIIVICVCLALALFLFDQDDINYFAGGITSGLYPRNPMGKWGAYTAWYMMLTFGLATPISIALVFFCALRRLIFNKYLDSVGFFYIASIILFTVALSILLATLPDQFASAASKYNLATMPGGVVGQRLGNPDSGWFHITLNTTGTAIFASLCICGALYYIWRYDWQKLVIHAINALKSREGKSQPDDTIVRPKPKPQEEIEQPKSTPQPPVAPPPPPKTETTIAKTIIKPREEVPPPPPFNSLEGYRLPPIDLLNIVETAENSEASEKEIKLNEELLQQELNSFGIEAQVVDSVPGPQVTLIKISMKPGVKVDKISSLEGNIMMALKATSLRILTPIPGDNRVGVEVPNKVLKPVSVRSLLEDPLWRTSKCDLPLLLGKNIAGKTIIIDLAKAPHLLIAGATGAGKSVCMNIIIMSMLYKYSPDQLKLIMVDPKQVEFAAYQKLPHLLTPVIFDTEKVALALKWAVREMERRLKILQKAGSRDLLSFNARPIEKGHPVLLDDEGQPIPDRMPFIVVIIDELADIMATAKVDVETSLSRLAAKARATGIHVIIATQRPDVKVITGTIKSNFPVRIAFRVASATDSMTILGGKGAESLLGKGDMLYKSGGIGLERIQGAMAEDEERNRVVEYIAQQLPQSFEENMFTVVEDGDGGDGGGGHGGDGIDGGDGDENDLYERAKHIVLTEKKTSISYLQRRLGVGYNKAATLMEELEDNGIVGPDPGNSGKREILVTKEEHGNPNDALDNDF